MSELPDMDFCRAQGWVIGPALAAPYGLTKAGLPRKFPKHTLNYAEIQRKRRAGFIAAGLTSRGTPRIYRRSAGLK
jgi:hypothetical protein